MNTREVFAVIKTLALWSLLSLTIIVFVPIFLAAALVVWIAFAIIHIALDHFWGFLITILLIANSYFGWIPIPDF